VLLSSQVTKAIWLRFGQVITNIFPDGKISRSVKSNTKLLFTVVFAFASQNKNITAVRTQSKKQQAGAVFLLLSSRITKQNATHLC